MYHVYSLYLNSSAPPGIDSRLFYYTFINVFHLTASSVLDPSSDLTQTDYSEIFTLLTHLFCLEANL